MNALESIQEKIHSFVNKYNIYPNGIILGREIVSEILTSNEFTHTVDAVAQVYGLEVIHVDLRNLYKIQVVLKEEE